MRKKKVNTILKVFVLIFISITNILHLSANDNNSDSIVSQYPYLSFKEYLNQVGKNNLTYIAEKYNIQIADAEVISQKVLPDPEISIEGTDNGQFYRNAKKGYVLNFGLDYTIELGNKRGARVALARSEAELERLNVEAFFQELRAEATNAYIEAMMQKDLFDVKKSSFNYMRQLSVSDSIRFNLGEINENEARQSKVEASTLLIEVYQQEADYKSSLVQLNQYMGNMSTMLNLPTENWSVFDKKYDLTNLITIALDNRVDLVAARKSTEVATKGLKLVKAERKMDLGVSLGYEINSKVKAPEEEERSYKALIAGVSVPLKFSNRNKGAIKSAQYAIEKSKVENLNTSLEIQVEVSQAFFNYEASQKQVEQFKNGLLSDSQKLLDGMVYKYKRGDTDILEVLIAQRTYNEVQEQYYEVLKANASALVELQKACGIWDIEL